VQKQLLPTTTTGFELILPERGIRLLASSDDSYAVIQWIECLKTQVLHVLSDDEGVSLLTSNSMFAVEVAPLEPMPWLGAHTPDHTAMHIDPMCSLAAFHGTAASVQITNPQLLARLHGQDYGSRIASNDTEDCEDEQEDDGDSDDVHDSGECDSDEFDEYPVGSNRRLSATMDTSPRFFHSNRNWNDSVAVVLDMGSYAVKAGLGCDSFPSVVERSYDVATGSPLVYREHVGAVTTEAVVRVYNTILTCFLNLAVGHLSSGVAQITTNWDAVTSMWDDIFHHKMGTYDALCLGRCFVPLTGLLCLAGCISGISPTDHTFVLTEAPDMTRVSKQTMAEIMFEYFNAPAITIQSAGVLALYAQGIWTGVVVDCGNRTKITPVYEGTVIPHAVMQSCFGGMDVDNALTSMLVEKFGSTYSRDSSSLDMQRFKEQHAFVARDSDSAAGMGAGGGGGGGGAAADADLAVKHRMSSGTNLLFDRERFLCGEELFTASLPNGCKGLAQGVHWCVQKCESVLRKQLFGSILLCGGTTGMDGFPERLQHDTTALLQRRSVDRAASDVPKVNVIAPRNRKYTAWLGGASLAQMDDFGDRILVSADEYDERGAAAF
jgi:actin-related protein